MKKLLLITLLTLSAGQPMAAQDVANVANCPNAQLLSSYRDWKQTVASGTFVNLSSDLNENTQDLVTAKNNTQAVYTALNKDIDPNTGAMSFCTPSAPRSPSVCCNSAVQCLNLMYIYNYQSYMYYLWFSKKYNQYAFNAQQAMDQLQASPGCTPNGTTCVPLLSPINTLDACATAVLGS